VARNREIFMMKIAENIQAVQQTIAECAVRFNRDVKTIHLLAVSKGQAADKIRAAYQCGLRMFGENYVQEAIDKQSELKDLDLVWVYQGNLQSNKTRKIAENFAWVISVSSFNIAQRLSAHRPAHLPPLNVCIQVNVSSEASKSGLHFDEVRALCDAILLLPNLKLRGLMAIPAMKDNFAEQVQQYQGISAFFNQLKLQGYNLDTLSLGMSADVAAAIANNSTMLRVGSSIFGARKK